MKDMFSAIRLSINVEGLRALFLTKIILILQIMSVMPAFFTGWIIDSISDKEYESVKFYFVILLLIIIAILIISPIKSWISVTFSQRATKEQSLIWTKKMLHQNLGNIINKGVGKIHISIERASLSFETIIIFIFSQWVPAIIEFIVVFVALIFVIGPIPSLIFVAFGLLYFYISYIFQMWKRPYLARVNNAEDDLADGFVNVFSKMRTIKAYRAISDAQEIMVKAFGNYAVHAERLGLVSGLISSVQSGYVSIGMFSLLAFGSLLLQQDSNWFSVGEFVTSLTLFGMLSASVNKLSAVLSQSVDFEEDLRTLNTLIGSEDCEKISKIRRMPENGTIVLKSGDIIELPSGDLLIQDDIQLERGDRILISGDSGSGKSSILTVISDMFEDELCVYEVQEPEFIEDSSLLGVSKIKSDLIELFELPVKSTLDLDEASGGEKKRFGIARAINTGRIVQIFDEPTSGLNDDLKRLVWRAFENMTDRCIIVSSHDNVPEGWITKHYVIKNGSLSLKI